MKNLPAVFALAAATLVAANLFTVKARTLPMGGLGCLFQCAQSRLESRLESRGARFSWAPMTERLALRRAKQEQADQRVPPSEETPVESGRPAQLSASFNGPAAAATEDAAIEHWRLFEALRRWQSDPEVPGLSHAFRNPNSCLALDYSDIFETGRAPYKGGHGVSLFYRHKF